jgi:hypothetical protein
MQNQIDVTTIRQVYSGRNGACCCGCAGKHTYSSTDVAGASKRRGYEVTPDEVSDRTVKMIVGKMNRLPAWHPPLDLDNADGYRMDHGDHVSAVVGQRLYIAYRT